MRVYLDTCCLCRPYDDLTNIRNKIESESVLFLLDLIDSDELQWVKSEFLEFEISNIKSFTKRKRVQKFLDYKEIEFVEVNDNLVKRAKELSRLRIQNGDAMHVISAIFGKADIFLSTDDGLISAGKKNESLLKIKFFNPAEFIYEVN